MTGNQSYSDIGEIRKSKYRHNANSCHNDTQPELNN